MNRGIPDDIDPALLKQILDALETRKPICYKDFPDYPEEEFDRAIEWVVDQVNSHAKH